MEDSSVLVHVLIINTTLLVLYHHIITLTYVLRSVE